MKVKLFTHDDLDGAGCAILGKIAYGNCIDVEFVSYRNVNDKVLEFFQNTELRSKYTRVYITDISVNEETAKIIDLFYSANFNISAHYLIGDEMHTKNNPNFLYLLDHHETEWLEKYPWASIKLQSEILQEDTSGTYEFFVHLEEIGDLVIGEDKYKALKDFVNNVRLYDTYLWKKKYNTLTPKMYHNLFHIYGKERFVEYMIDKFYKTSNFKLNEEDLKMLELYDAKSEKYIVQKLKTVLERDILGYKAGIVFAEENINDLADAICTANTNLDLAIVITSSTISYRTKKEDVDVSQIAKTYNGGGRQATAGSPIPTQILQCYLDLLFDKKKKNF